MLGFLSPLFLLGAAAAAAAVVALHFFSRKSVRAELWFTHLRLLEEILASRRRLKTVENWLLILLRTITAALILAALAGPFLHWGIGNAENLQKPSSDFHFIMDLSYSMNFRHSDGRSALEHAKETAQRLGSEIFSSFPRARIHVTGFSDRLHFNSETAASDSLQLERLLAALKTFPHTTRHNLWVDHLKGQESPSGVFIFSDFASHGMNQDQSFEGFRFPVILLRASPGAYSNKMLEARFSGSQAVSLRVRCFGEALADKSSVKVSLSNAESQKLISTTLVPACSETETVLPPDTLRQADQQGDIALQASLPADRLPTDDAQTLIVQKSQTGSALIMDGEPGRRANEGESFYLRESLKVRYPAGRWSIVSQGELTQFTRQNPSLQGLEQIWLLHPQKMEPALQKSLESFLSDPSKKVVITLGPTADYESIRKLLGLSWQTVKAPNKESWTIAPPEPSAQQPYWLGQIPYASLNEFELKSIPVTAYGAPSESAGIKTWLKLSNGAPLLIETSQRGAKVFIFTSTFDAAWTGLPLKGFFSAVSGALMDEPAIPRFPSQVFWGETLSLALPESSWKQMTAIAPSGTLLQPLWRGGLMHLGPFEEPGIYELHWKGLRPNGAPKRTACALNLPQESDLCAADKSSIQTLLGRKTIWREIALEEAAAHPKKAVSLLAATPLTRPLFAGALILLTFESLVGFLFRRKE